MCFILYFHRLLECHMNAYWMFSAALVNVSGTFMVLQLKIPKWTIFLRSTDCARFLFICLCFVFRDFRRPKALYHVSKRNVCHVVAGIKGSVANISFFFSFSKQKDFKTMGRIRIMPFHIIHWLFVGNIFGFAVVAANTLPNVFFIYLLIIYVLFIYLRRDTAGELKKHTST